MAACLLLGLEGGEIFLNLGLGILIAHLGLRAIEDRGDTVGKILDIDFLDPARTEILAHAQSESIADTVKFFLFHNRIVVSVVWYIVESGGDSTCKVR